MFNKSKKIEKGDRFIINYGAVTVPIYKYIYDLVLGKDWLYHKKQIKIDIMGGIYEGSIARLKTVVEYIGDNQYRDLINVDFAN